METPIQSLTSEKLYLALEKQLQALGYSYQKPKDLANCILKASEYYIERSGVSPWSDPAFLAAYMAHFLPMNIFRIQKGLRRVSEALGKDMNSSFFDYGGGPLTFLLAYLLEFKALPTSYSFYDLSEQIPKHGLQILKALELPEFNDSWFKSHHKKLNQLLTDQTLCLSYSLNELNAQTKKMLLQKSSQLLIFEPSTREISRQLLEFRKEALLQNFYSLAPCTHSLECPMLKHSRKDWCFDRAMIELPTIATGLYKLLPFDSRYVTFSYLYLSKTPASKNLSQIRIVGDNLKEKGKTRTMVCQSSEREFVSVLKKQKLDLKLNRGDLFVLPKDTIKKGPELRLPDHLA